MLKEKKLVLRASKHDEKVLKNFFTDIRDKVGAEKFENLEIVCLSDEEGKNRSREYRYVNSGLFRAEKGVMTNL